MDAKALAKSKRAHSQHHSKRSHPNQTAKAPSDGTSGLKNAKKQPSIIQQPHQSWGLSTLPVNWDRYEEEFDSDSAESSRDSRYSDVVKPKSKGADYRYLISEAQAQSQTQLDPYLDCFPSLDDFLPGFNQGIGSILSARGEGILSSIRDDNFIVEDKATTSYEAPFLSLNLHVLAEKLAKVDLSKRLFIEADLLPPDLCAEEFKAGSEQEPDRMPKTYQSKTTTRISDEVDAIVFSRKHKVAEPNSEVTSSDGRGRSHHVPASSRGSKSVHRSKVVVEQSDAAGQNRGLELAFPDKKLPAFGVASAEAELDMLLDSFDGAKFLDSPGSKEKSSHSISILQDISMESPQLSKRSKDSSKFTSATTNFDDAIDDLLGETSNLMSQKVVLKPKDMKAFSLDDSIDDLLAETSNLMNQSRPSQAQKLKPYSLENNSSTSSGSEPKSKVLSDFDSWLDTI